jgi:hypothetical protein
MRGHGGRGAPEPGIVRRNPERDFQHLDGQRTALELIFNAGGGRGDGRLIRALIPPFGAGGPLDSPRAATDNGSDSPSRRPGFGPQRRARAEGPLQQFGHRRLIELRLHPITFGLRALRGERTIHGRPLPSVPEAVALLRRLTGQDFGEDAAAWGAWLRANRGVYTAGPGDPRRAGGPAAQG